MDDTEEIIVVTMRCIDTSASCCDVDRIKCDVCGEMTWLSSSWRGRKIDRVICDHCFEDEKANKSGDYSACVTRRCLEDAQKYLKDILHLGGTDEDIKKKMISYLEKKIGKKITIVD